MATLTLTTPTRSGVATSGSAVASSDVINRSQLGTRGVTLEIINGNAGADAMTISDASTTSNGAPAAALAPSVPAGQSRAFKITPDMCDPVTGQVTITHGVTATVTYKMYPRD